MDTPARGMDASVDALIESAGPVDDAALPEFLWMASTDGLYWGRPRRVRAQALLTGPDPKRQYLLLAVEAPAEEPDPDRPTPRHVVVTPRHQHEIAVPRPGSPLRLHLWVVDPAADIARGDFRAPRPQSDSWVELWLRYEEAERYGAKPWW